MTKPTRFQGEVFAIPSVEDLGAASEALHEVMLEENKDNRA